MIRAALPRAAVAGLACLLLAACAGGEVEFDPARPHHGDGVFVSDKQGGFLDHWLMRLREPGPPPRDPAEIRAIVGVADRELLNSYAAVPRVTWIGHATSLVQFRDVAYLTDPHLTRYPFYFEAFVEPRYTSPALTFEQMPPIDFVLISHNHYDSLDHRTVDLFGNAVFWYVPLGLKAWFVDRGIDAGRVRELDW